MKKLLFLLTLVLTTQISSAQDRILNYQGVLLDNQGQPVADDTYSAVFELFNVETNGSALWTDSNVSITTQNGSFSVRLGSGASKIPATVDFSQTLWLRISVSGSNFTSRVRIDPDPTALFVESDLTSAFTNADNSVKSDLQTQMQTKIDSLAGVVTSLTSGLQMALDALETSMTNRGSAVPIGTIQAFGGDINSIPEGWLLCDGSQQNIDDYPKLAEVLDTYWGALTSSQFRLPDLRGQFLRGTSNPLDAINERRHGGSSDGDLVGIYEGWVTGLPRYKPFTGITDLAGQASGHIDAGSYNLANGAFKTASGVFSLSNGSSAGVQNAAGASTFRRATIVIPNHTHSLNISAGGDLETRPDNARVHYIIKAK